MNKVENERSEGDRVYCVFSVYALRVCVRAGKETRPDSIHDLLT